MQVNIKWVNFPSQNSTGKYGNIVTQEGVKIMVPVDMLNMFRQGMVCEIGTKEQQWGDTLMTIATSGPGGGATAGVQGQPAQARPQWAGSQRAPQRAPQGFQPRVFQGGGGQPAGIPVSHDQARQIFVTGVVGRAMGSGKFAASEIAVLTEAANEAYDRLDSRNRPGPAALPAPSNYGEPPPAELGDPGPELQ